MFKLRNVEFRRVMNSSGARGFFGEGTSTDEYWYHRYWKLLGLDYTGSTFVAKTTTFDRRQGNMPLDRKYRPKNFYPSCIRVKFRKGVVLNAVGLSGPGVKALLAEGRWQRRTDPFMLSFMAVGQTHEDKVEEAQAFVSALKPALNDFRAPIALQVNLSCPNVKPGEATGAYKLHQILDVLSALDVPLVAKLGPTVEPSVAMVLERHEALDAICVGNTLPWGSIDQVDWAKLFGSYTSPLEQYGGGGLSGAPLLPIVSSTIRKIRHAGFSKPIIGCGGVLRTSDAVALMEAGVDAIELGVMGMLRPWRVKGTIYDINLWDLLK